jgi:putative spermidine/putrescine transport system substrate-binding protein
MTRKSQPFNRRLLLSVIGSGTALVLVTACSGQASDEQVKELTNPEAGTVPDGLLDGHTLTFAGDGGTTQEGQTHAFFEPFAKESGVQIDQDSPQSLAKVKSQVNSGHVQWDFLSMSSDAIARECGVLFEKLDPDKIDTSHVPEDQIGGAECGIPSNVYGTFLTYQTSEFSGEKPKVWKDFFDVDKFPGTRAIYSGSGKIDSNSVEAAALAAGWDPQKEDFNEKWANKGLDEIEKLGNSVVFFDSGAQAQQMLESGEAALGMVWNGRALAAARNGANIEMSWDQWVSMADHFAIVKGSENTEAAYYALNYTLGKKQQEAWTEETAYSPTHDEADPDIDKTTKRFLTTVGNRTDTAIEIDLDFWSQKDVVSDLQDRWSKIVAGG